MKFNIFKRGFSLTELLIVLVVVAVLFSAMIPMVTKRTRGETDADEPIWVYVKDDPQKSAFFDPGSSAITAAAYVGFVPTGDMTPLSKVVLRAKTRQNMIQFRSGNDGNGTLAGVFTLTPENMVLGSRMAGDPSDNYNKFVGTGTFNTVLGIGAASALKGGTFSTTAGSNSSMGGPSTTNFVNTVAVGNRANMYAKAENSTVIGSNAGKSESWILNTVAIGPNVLGLPTSSGRENVFVGYNTASTGIDTASSQYNVIINSSYYGKTPVNNTIIGYKVFEGGFDDAQNITAIGYNACASFNLSNDPNGSGGSTTCIGYNSAGKVGKNYETKDLGWESDGFDHLFIGSKPQGGFPGRSVLELHNIPYKLTPSGSVTAAPYSVGPTVVMNSHLVVRGNLYIPDSNDGQVAAMKFYKTIYHKEKDTVKGRDRCGRKCLIGRRGWRDGPECKWLKIIAGVLLMAGAAAAIIFSGGTAIVLAPDIIGAALVITGWGAWGGLASDALFNGQEYDRAREPISYTGLGFEYSAADGSNLHKCSTDYAPYFTSSYCPNLLRTSDERLKSDISPNNDALNKLLYVVPYKYTYKADVNAKPQVGVIAQDLEKYFPSAVTNDSDGYKSIRWDEMLFASVNSVKVLDGSVILLDRNLDKLEKGVVSVGKDQKAIKKRIKDMDKRITKLENN